MNKTKTNIAILLALILLITAPVYALTASIGNARMILNYEWEKNKENIIEKSILVKNVNDVPVSVQLKPDNDLKDITTIPDNNITLSPKEERDVKFQIKIEQPGEITGKINVFFSDPDGKQAGVVLSSSIIIFAVGEGSAIPSNTTKPPITNPPINNITTDNGNKTPVSVSVGGTGNTILNNNASKDESGANLFVIASIALLAVILLAIIIIIIKRS